MDGISLADAMALSNREDSGFSFGGIGGLILILLFFLIFGHGSFGGYNQSSTALSDLEREVLNGTSNTQKAILDANYNNLLSFKDAQHQLSQCCCELEKTIHGEGEATRSLIQNNTIQELRDRLDASNTALTVKTITDQVVSQLKPCPIPAYLTCSPYASYGCNGCGGNGNI